MRSWFITFLLAGAWTARQALGGTPIESLTLEQAPEMAEDTVLKTAEAR
jgi:hypothetical protein